MNIYIKSMILATTLFLYSGCNSSSSDDQRSDSWHPEEVKYNINTRGISTSSITVEDDILDIAFSSDDSKIYAAGHSKGIHIIDKATLALQATIDTFGLAHDIKSIGNGYYALADQNGGLGIYQESNNSLVEVAFDSKIYAMNIEMIYSQYIAVASGEDGVNIYYFNVEDKTLEKISSIDTNGYAHGLSYSDYDGHLFVATTSNGVVKINIEDIENPSYVKTFTSPTNAHDVVVTHSGLLVVAAKEKGIYIENLASGTDGIFINTKSDALGVDFYTENSKTYISVANSDKGIALIDITDTTDPQYAIYQDTNGYAHQIVVDSSNQIAYLADGNYGLAKLDFSDLGVSYFSENIVLNNRTFYVVDNEEPETITTVVFNNDGNTTEINGTTETYTASAGVLYLDEGETISLYNSTGVKSTDSYFITSGYDSEDSWMDRLFVSKADAQAYIDENKVEETSTVEEYDFTAYDLNWLIVEKDDYKNEANDVSVDGSIIEISAQKNAGEKSRIEIATIPGDYKRATGYIQVTNIDDYAYGSFRVYAPNDYLTIESLPEGHGLDLDSVFFRTRFEIVNDAIYIIATLEDDNSVDREVWFEPFYSGTTLLREIAYEIELLDSKNIKYTIYDNSGNPIATATKNLDTDSPEGASASISSFKKLKIRSTVNDNYGLAGDNVTLQVVDVEVSNENTPSTSEANTTETETSGYATADLAGDWFGTHTYIPTQSAYSVDEFTVDNSKWEIGTDGFTTQTLLESSESLGSFTFTIHETLGQLSIDGNPQYNYLNAGKNTFVGVTNSFYNYGLLIGVKKADTYSLNDLEGNWQSVSMNTFNVDGQGYYGVDARALSINSSGSISVSNIYSNSDDDATDSFAFSGISSDGELLIDSSGTSIYLNEAKDVMINSVKDSGGKFIDVVVKQASSYSPTDLEGTWNLISISTPTYSTSDNSELGFEASRVVISNTTISGVDLDFTVLTTSDTEDIGHTASFEGMPMTITSSGEILNNPLGDAGIDEYSYMNASKDVITYIGNDSTGQRISIWVKQD